MEIVHSTFDASYRESRKVAWDGYIEVLGNRYSLPHKWGGQIVTICIALDGKLRVYSCEELVASHYLRDSRERESYRLKEKQRAGILTSSSAPVLPSSSESEGVN